MFNLKLSSGYEMPFIGLGTWQLEGRKCREIVAKAIELGYRHIDTAEAYGNQKEIGKAIKGKREQLFITSKVWFEHLHYQDVLEACEQTLKELKTDYLDLYLIHWPNRSVAIEETMKAMKKLLDDGLIRNIGVSNFTINHLKDALKTKVKIVANQVEFHPYLYQEKLLEFCRQNGIAIIAYSPLGRGNILKDDVLVRIARKHNKTTAQVCLRWLYQKGIAAIPKSSSVERLKENIDIFDFSLDQKDVKEIDGLNRNIRFVNPVFSDFDY
ncbi:MAG: aldo/keto reductase [Candidatus Aenigmarchaeota archaeon]|nr:aldo/keto reductase [Candidatus Aenigmarchaeota archaeon]